ncbi:MAG: hypothetical protein WBV82_30840 [Myxococcaceae bacterium]
MTRSALVAGLIAASIASAQDRRIEFDIPDVVARIPVSDVIHVDGLPLQIVAVRSKRHWTELEKVLTKQIQNAGLFVSPKQARIPGLDNAHITALDPETKISYTLILTPEPDGTTVFIGEANHAQRQAAPAANTIAPVFPGGTSVLVTRQESADVVNYTAPAAAAEVDAFYKEVLSASGFKEIEPRVFEGSGQQLSISVTGRGEKRSTVMVIRRGAGVTQ